MDLRSRICLLILLLFSTYCEEPERQYLKYFFDHILIIFWLFAISWLIEVLFERLEVVLAVPVGHEVFYLPIDMTPEKLNSKHGLTLIDLFD
jgi:hypothetical protein